MSVLLVPGDDGVVYPTLGPAICDFIEERCVFGPGSLAGEPAVLDPQTRALFYSAYEVFPKGHRRAGKRRFPRVAWELRKGLAKTEKLAWIAFVELHPESPARCDGFDARGNPVGRPVAFPFIPLMAVTEGQVSEQAYAVLKYVIENSPDVDLFDVGADRIHRLSPTGQDDGRAVPVSGAPGSRDGALTTFQGFDEAHRLTTPRQFHAHETMIANLPKRPREDPWMLYVSTAGNRGQKSIQRDVRIEAEAIEKNRSNDKSLFFFARWAGPEHKDLDSVEGRVAAIADATGPAGEFGTGQYESIAAQWDRLKADKRYLERVWLNRWATTGSRAFDMADFDPLGRCGRLIPVGAQVTIGFDGARRRDATGFVLTDIDTGLQQLWAGWEKPGDDDDWEIPEAEATEALAEAMTRFKVLRFYGDPPYWQETMGSWSAKWPDIVNEWWTNNTKRMAEAVRVYLEAIASKSITFGGTETQFDDLMRHLSNAGRRDLKMMDEEGQPFWVLCKPDGDQTLKFDYAMASILSWIACLDVRRKPKKDVTIVRRIR